MKTLTGTKEWAVRNFNICLGCLHDCKYCYAKEMWIRLRGGVPEKWKEQVVLPGKLEGAGKGRPTRIMFPSSHDIVPECLDICLEALDRMLAHGHTVLVVSKPHRECIEAICDRFTEYKGSLIFRFTMGAADSEILKFWEPNASSFEERLACLDHAYAKGYQTSVSCEPMLDGKVERVVEAVLPFVTDTMWIGVMKDVRRRLKINGADEETLKRGEELMRLQNRSMILDLHGRLKESPKIRWKDSIRKMLGPAVFEEVKQS